MSHSKERHEKICLNCNAELSGRFCHLCGQENIEPKESVWSLISHFFYDITHFDGKFFSTTGLLVKKPGFLPAEYIKGRRARYLHPIRMYVFSSALFFLIFFMLFKPDKFVKGDWTTVKEKIKDSVTQLTAAQAMVLKTAQTRQDSLDIIGAFSQAKEKLVASYANNKAGKDSASLSKKLVDSFEVDEDDDNPDLVNWFDKGSRYSSVAAYDAAQQALSPDKRDGWWTRKVQHRNIELQHRYRGKEKAFIRDLMDKFLHMLPYLLFISLPLYALFMKLLYFRHKQFYYVDHGIFFIYLYIFTFIFFLVYFSVMELRIYTHQDWIGWIEAALILGGVYYTYKAMRRFYGQSRAMTLLKFFLLNMLCSFIILILFIFFFTLTVFRI